MGDLEKSIQKITLYYDKECPFCSKYANFLKLKENFKITLKDARENLDEISIVCGNLDINDGFIVVYKNDCFQGAKALAFLNSAVDKTTILGKLHFFFSYENVFSKVLYKILFILRKVILFILRKDSQI
jgi:predicted DCC family thiol-disulfide oxidoreductase YuxK